MRRHLAIAREWVGFLGWLIPTATRDVMRDTYLHLRTHH